MDFSPRRFTHQPTLAVVHTLGVPDRTFVAGGHTFLEYQSHNGLISAGPQQMDSVGPRVGAAVWAGGGAALPSCALTTIDTVADRVVGWTQHGNSC